MSDQDIKEMNDIPIGGGDPAENNEAAHARAHDGGSAATDDAVALKAEVASLRDQLLRRAAEFENFKRRTREEKDMLIKYGTEGLLLNLLPVIDDFERSLDAGKTHPDFPVFYSGIEIIYGKLLRALEQRGLKPMEAKGKPFDVDFHDALLQVPTSESEPGTVLDVAEKGYLLHDKVLRHAKVTVAVDAAESDGKGQA